MGKIHLSQLEKIQELPSHVSSGKAHEHDRWAYRSGTYHKVGEVYPWKRIKRLLTNSIGKKFSVVFSDYCKQVPTYQQVYFLDEFKESLKRYNYNQYYVDDNGLIQRYGPSNPYKGPYTFYSIDCVIESRHKITGKKAPEYYWHDKKYVATDYEPVIVKGWVKMFDSRNDPEFKRLNTEKKKAMDKEFILKYRTPNMSDEDFRKILKAKELKERAEDLIKIEAHGFDPTTSFRK